ncbi:MAG: DUF937 domain-containing protein [Prolixibacteraceae bacterium]|jgi:hypothetical protein|nr:DUF937 domain-containing protein [Prolixibacteraceae bacterium]MDI9563805.1 DUF937 domain-containing protein [Bacteroidota bacterium]NLS99976.1 DUF937 domain-containing protein [Bacteroidales bacterium]OQB81632.1 MAG: hypothetical protein BWX87_00613 [Bacteroidetes bacterium ADurb.Bin123]HNU76816.1 DUF937 domain-containing protein [Prolixibacteraceae bacterium]
MDNILDSILSQIDKNTLEVIGQQANISPDKAQNALKSAIPILMSALARNSSTPEGASALQNAVAKDHDGSLLDNLGALLGKKEVIDDGAGILKHILGNKQGNVEQYLSKNSGLDSAAIAKILKMAAPIVMGYLGKKSNAGSNTGIIGDLLNSYLNTQTKKSRKSQGMINQILDRDGDGNIMDDIGELGISFLGKMLKKK